MFDFLMSSLNVAELQCSGALGFAKAVTTWCWTSSKYTNLSSLNHDSSMWWACSLCEQVLLPTRWHSRLVVCATDLQTTGVPGQAAGFNLILFASMWQILEIGKARVSLLHDLGLSSKWEFKIKGNSTSIWEFLCNCCFSQMICEIPSGLKILHAA